MGPSGSGKTSTLNILAQRLKLSPGAIFEGEVRANNRSITAANFGKIGAYVWQHDILVQTMTTKELLVFAAKLRTTLDSEDIDDKVTDILQRLGLWNCRDTKIGGFLFKGLSGGERKRASIGYELITEPQILICDEPTSGLDSVNAYKIIKVLKNEAKLGRTIILTIHSPNQKTFNLIDRLLLLHDGYQIYQGKV
jgi:ABC-type multidrug transport system ATPase subunit